VGQRAHGETRRNVLNTTLMGNIVCAFVGAAIAFALGYSTPVAAQSRELQRRLEAATRVECTFSMLAIGTWDGEQPQAAVQATELTATFHDINIDEGTAEAGSDFGDSFISVRYTAGYLHFMQMRNAGPLYVTTILAHESTDGRMKAVHTRHEYTATIMPGFTSRPEMYVGDCAVT
jgi:hypothetical protein